MHVTQMYHRCIFAQVSSHTTELSCYCCLFTQVGTSYKCDLLSQLNAFNAYELLALSTKHSASLLTIVANVIPFFLKILPIAILKDTGFCC